MDELTNAVDVKETGQPVDAARLQEFNKILRQYKAGKARLEQRVVSAEQWWKLRNEAEARKQGYNNDRDFSSKSAWLHNVIVSKHADAMENYPEALVLPREQGDKDQAKTLSAIIPCILEENDFEQTYSDAMWQKLKTGTAVYKVTWDSAKLNGLGDIAITNIDLLSVFWEPGIKDIQKSRYFFHCELQDDDLLEEQYPELKDKPKGASVALTKFVYDDNVPTDNKSLVVDVYYKVGGVLHYCKYCGNTVLHSTENDMAAPAEDMAAPMPADDIAQPALGAGAPMAAPAMQPGMAEPMVPPEPQHRGLYDDGLYPFVFDPLFPIEGSPCGYGYVDLCQNSQIAIDMMRTAFVKNVKAGATPRYFERVDGSVNEEEFLDLTKAIVHVNGNIDDTGLRPINHDSLPGNYLSVYDSLISELRETSGNTESANGIYSGGVTAASSIAALQEASGKTSRDSSRASYRAFRRMINMVIERIRQFYDLPRQFRITGQFGQEQFIAFDNSLLRPQMTGIGDTQIGFTQPVFDIKVEVQKRNAYTRTSQNELAIQLYQLGVFNPVMAQQAVMLLDMMDFDDKDALMQKLQQSLMMQQMMGPMMGGPIAGGEPADLDKAANDGEDSHVSKARERANEAAAV